MRTRAVSRIHAVDVAVEQARTLVDVVGQGRIGRRELGGDGKPAFAQDALQATARDVAFLFGAGLGFFGFAATVAMFQPPLTSSMNSISAVSNTRGCSKLARCPAPSKHM